MRKKSIVLKKHCKAGLCRSHFVRGWLWRDEGHEPRPEATVDADPFSVQLSPGAPQLPVPVTCRSVSWPGDFTRNCFFQNEIKMFYLKKNTFASGENCLVISRFNFHPNLSLTWLELTGLQNFNSALCRLIVKKKYSEGFQYHCTD